MELELILKFLKEKVDKEKFHIWKMDTSFEKILERFREKCKTNKIKDFSKLKARFNGKNKKGTSYFSLLIDEVDVTPVGRKTKEIKGVSQGAIRQYLQFLDIASIISFGKQTIEPKTYFFPIIDTYFLNENLTNEKIVIKICKQILRNGFNSKINYIRNIWLSIILLMIIESFGENNKNLIKEINKLGFNQVKKTNKTFEQIIEDIKYTYKNFYKNELLSYFKQCYIYIFNEYDENIKLPKNETNKLIKGILDSVAEKRLKISKKIREIRNYTFEDSDIEKIKVPIKTLDAAHIWSVSAIKQEALIEAFNPKIDKEAERNDNIEKILKNIENTENLLLIPHNYHYLWDKNFLRITEKGNFIKIDLEKNKNLFKEFGIRDEIQIKEKIMQENKNMIEFIRKRNAT